MQKKERIFLYGGLSIVVILLAGALILFSHRTPPATPDNVLSNAFSAYEKGDYKGAMIYFAQADLINVPEAAFALGAMNFSGKGMPKNIDKAMAYYNKAALMNYAPAQMTLALLYAQGEAVKKDEKKAVEFASKAAENGDVEAQMLLARWYENGHFLTKDTSKAVTFYEKAAQQGNQDAKIALAIIYKDGKDGIVPNFYTAARWQESLQKQKEFENIFQNRPKNLVEKTHP